MNRDRKAYFRNYYEANKAKAAAQSAARYKVTRARQLAKAKAWQANHKERVRKVQAAYRARNQERIQERGRARNLARRKPRPTLRVVKKARATPAEVARRLLAKADQFARRGYSGVLHA